jgi:hypothetical protein
MEGIVPLSDLFKKSPKQAPPKRPSQEDIFGSPTLQKNRIDAATEVMEIFDRNFQTPQGPHAGTALSAAGWLAGTSLYRSFGHAQNPEPGTVMLSEKANQESQKLLNLFMYYLLQSGAQIKPEQFILQVPEAHKPLQTILQVQTAHQDEYNAIMKRHGLDYLEGARAGMIVCSMAFGYLCLRRKDIDPRIGAGIISTGIVAGAKTAPIPLKPQGDSSSVAAGNNTQNNQLIEVLKSIAVNSTSGSGVRLVIGEGMQSMGEALSKGGKYILLHPEVVNKLKQNNIDPYLVYEAAMRIEIGGRIPQIDFVSGNADELLQTWRGKPQEQFPIHVRQLLWLAANASGLGYEQRGNSWYLKQ